MYAKYFKTENQKGMIFVIGTLHYIKKGGKH